jgi:hypothetical protein
LIALLALVALPAIAADPPGKPKGSAAPKVDAVEVTLTGTVAASKDADGRTTYTLSSGGKTYTLHAGPPWYWGDADPLKAFVGKTVTIVGETTPGAADVDVLSVDGKAIRASGRPPWAGGWKSVGAKHPGWTQEKADRFKAKFGDCFPPGQCKAKPSPAP